MKRNSIEFTPRNITDRHLKEKESKILFIEQMKESDWHCVKFVINNKNEKIYILYYEGWHCFYLDKLLRIQDNRKQNKKIEDYYIFCKNFEEALVTTKHYFLSKEIKKLL